jgi:hypothetical protein
MVSEDSIGETVRPVIHHWMTEATVSKLRRISVVARQRLVFDYEYPPAWSEGSRGKSDPSRIVGLALSLLTPASHKLSCLRQSAAD